MKKKSEPDPGFTERSGFKKNFFYFSRLLALLLLVCFISLLSDSTEPIPETLQSLIAAFPGDIRIVIDKSAYSLALYKGDRPVKSCWAVFGRGGTGTYGDKRRRGDRRIPEGDISLRIIINEKQTVL